MMRDDQMFRRNMALGATTQPRHFGSHTLTGMKHDDTPERRMRSLLRSKQRVDFGARRQRRHCAHALHADARRS